MRPRILLFLAALLLSLPLAIAGLRGLPAFGHYRGPYGDIVNRIAPPERHVTNMVTAVTFDIRGFDTMGEEFILFAAVTGVVMLLRGSRGEETSAAPATLPGRPVRRRSAAVTALGRWLAALTFLWGLYVVLHAQLTPGGGFQGGAVIGSAMLLTYLGDGYRAWRRAMPSQALDIGEAIGAGGFVLAGLLPMAVGAAFLQDTLPLGHTSALLSGGLILVVNLATAFAVACGFAMMFLEFLEETRAPKDDEE